MPTIREIIRSIDLTELNGGNGVTFADAIECATIYARDLGYKGLSVGTGGAYADFEVSADDAEQIADLVRHTGTDGVYRQEAAERIAFGTYADSTESLA